MTGNPLGCVPPALRGRRTVSLSTSCLSSFNFWQLHGTGRRVACWREVFFQPGLLCPQPHPAFLISSQFPRSLHSPRTQQMCSQENRPVHPNPFNFPHPTAPCDHWILAGFSFPWLSLPAKSSPIFSPQREQWLETVSSSWGR